MKLIPFLSKSSETTTWPWQCGTTSPRTLSFRADNNEPKKSYHHHLNFTIDQYYSPDDENVEKLIKGLRSERLFFEPGQTSSKLEEEETLVDTTPIHLAPSLVKESVAMSVESTDPFVDFRRSMEEMVTAHHHQEDDEGLMKVLDWEFLEDLLTCYLKMNVKSNHGYIVGAFVDLLVSLSTANNHHDNKSQPAAIVISSTSSSSSNSSDENCLLSSSTNTHSFTSPLSFCSSTCSTTSPCLSFPPQEAQDQIENCAI